MSISCASIRTKSFYNAEYIVHAELDYSGIHTISTACADVGKTTFLAGLPPLVFPFLHRAHLRSPQSQYFQGVARF